MLTSDPPPPLLLLHLGASPWGRRRALGGSCGGPMAVLRGSRGAGNWKHNCSRGGGVGGADVRRCSGGWRKERPRRKRRYRRRRAPSVADAKPPPPPPVYERRRCKSVIATAKRERAKKLNLNCLTAQRDFCDFFFFLRKTTGAFSRRLLRPRINKRSLSHHITSDEEGRLKLDVKYLLGQKEIGREIYLVDSR